MQKHQYQYKIVIIGNSAVGKTSILSRLCSKTFNESFVATLGVDLNHYDLLIGDESIRLTLWDTAGQQRFKTITRNYYRDSNAIIFAYDITCAKSFQQIQSWIRQTQQYAPSDICRMLIGNKVDIQDQRKVNYVQGKVLGNNYSMQFRQVSAKTGYNIIESIQELGEIVHFKFKQSHKIQNRKIGIQNSQGSIWQSKCCN